MRKCQAVVVAGRWRNPRAKLMAIIAASVAIDLRHVRAVQNVLVPLAGFHDGSPDDDGESDKQNRFDDHVFDTFHPSIGDRPATVVNKIGASTGSGAINGRCDIFAASAHRLEQTERREIGSVQREGTVQMCEVIRRRPRLLATDVSLDIGASLKVMCSWHSAILPCHPATRR
jgi:hypothetical protein